MITYKYLLDSTATWDTIHFFSKNIQTCLFHVSAAAVIPLGGGIQSGPPLKRPHHAQPVHVKHALDHTSPPVVPLPPPLNGRAAHPHFLPHGQPLSRSNARKQVISWMDAPDDVYFRASDQTK